MFFFILPATQISWVHSHVFSPSTPQYSCLGQTPPLREGEEILIMADPSLRPDAHIGKGFVKIYCLNSTPYFEYPSFTDGGGHTNWYEYLVKVFRKEPLDFSCANEFLSFSGPRIWEPCRTSSTRTCFEARGGSPTMAMACWNFNIFVDVSIGLDPQAVARKKTLGQHFGTQYQIQLSTSKDGFVKQYDISEFIKEGYGHFPDTNPGSKGPFGFSIVARKEMEGSQIKISLRSRTANGQ